MTALPPEAVALVDVLWTPGANTKPIQRRLKKAFGIDVPRAQIRLVATRNDPPKVRKSRREVKRGPTVTAAVGLVRFGFGPEVVPDRVRLVAAGTYAARGFRIGGMR